MALLTTEIGRCKKCGKYGPMSFMNHKQSQKYCDICKPVVEQEEIHNAILTLYSKGVTAKMYEKWLDEYHGKANDEQG